MLAVAHLAHAHGLAFDYYTKAINTRTLDEHDSNLAESLGLGMRLHSLDD